MSKDEEESTISSSVWTWEEDKAFECAVADTPEDCADRWEKIAEAVPGRTIEELKYHYELLVEDIDNIESGRVPLPCYRSSSEDGTDQVGESRATRKGASPGHSESKYGGGKGTRADQERRKGVAWTEDEHRLFLLGLEKFGKGDWRSISRNFVVSRTPTQVASHAQKYFIRLNSMNKDRRRSSIHDITSVGNGDEAAIQGPITGLSNVHSTGGPSGKSSKQPQLLSSGPGANLYGGTTLGQPVGGQAVGTPVHLHSPGHMAYGVRAPVPMIPGAPTNMVPTTYSAPHASAHM